jgi:Domain of unknown function (DUF4145)
MSVETKKNYCLRCNFDTNHIPLHKETVNSDNEDFEYQIKYFIVKCCGCNRISFREEFINIEEQYPDEDDMWHPIITIDTYPNERKVKQSLRDTFVLPKKLKVVYEEAINAFNSNCFLLTGVGFRAIIEAICLDKNIIGKDLSKKIDNLVKQKLITEKEAQRLHSIRFLGNDSVHEMNVPDKQTLYMVLNIVEHLLNNLYIIDYQAKDYLETIINQFQDFEDLITINLTNFERNDEIPLAKIMGKSYRRLNGKITDFENQLIVQINSKKYDKLELGKFDIYGNNPNKVQHFKIVK